MTTTLTALASELAQRLGDTGGDIWLPEEVQDNIREGYNLVTFRTGCLFATEVSPDEPASFTHTADFETDYLLPGSNQSPMAIQFTTEFERDYTDNANGPANHNHAWEFDDGHVTETVISALVPLPDDLYEIERAVWDTRRVASARSRYFEENDTRYELSTGEVEAIIQDKDGLRRLRKWRVPSSAYVPYDFDETTGYFDHTASFEEDYITNPGPIAQFTSAADAPFVQSTDTGAANHNYRWEHLLGYAPTPASLEWGIIVDLDTVDTDTPIGEWGEFVQVSGQHGIGDPWGIIVGVYKDTNLLRYEYRRRGYALGDNRDFEIPDRYTIYVRHYAQAKCLEREGDGQDLDLGAHYMSRFEAGIARMMRRKTAMNYQRKFVLGASTRTEGRLPLAKMPWAYGRVVR